MKKLFILILGLCLTSGYAQDLTGTWAIDKIIYTTETEEYILSPKGDNIFGTFINFTEISTFENYNAWPCGNDCFITTKGTYKSSQDNISIFVKTVEANDYCDIPNPIQNTSLGVFKISYLDGKIILKKLKQKTSR